MQRSNSSVLLIVALTVAVCIAQQAHAFNCAASMVLVEIAADTLAKTSPSTHALLRGALDYAYMTTGTSTMAELPCWFANLSSSSAAGENKHVNSNSSNSTSDDYSDYSEYLQCFSTDAAKAPCPPGSSGGGGAIRGRLGDAYAKAVATARTALHEDQPFLDDADRTSTAAFWLAVLTRAVANAHDPSRMCTLFSARFPHGDDGGANFTVGLSNATAAATMSLRDFVGSVGGLLDTTFEHPIEDSAADAARLRDLASTLQAAYASEIAPLDVADVTFSKWAFEGLNLCTHLVYHDNGAPLKDGEVVTSAYLLRVRRAMQRQLVLGGLRLARILSRSLSKS